MDYRVKIGYEESSKAVTCNVSVELVAHGENPVSENFIKLSEQCKVEADRLLDECLKVSAKRTLDKLR